MNMIKALEVYDRPEMATVYLVTEGTIAASANSDTLEKIIDDP